MRWDGLRWDGVLDWLRERYFAVDRRVLAIFRIAMGLLLLADVLRRLPFAAMFYSDGGVLPAALARARPPGDDLFSLFFWLSTPRAAQLGMLLCAAVYLAYLVGYRTRPAQVLAFVAFTSLDARNVLIENRGHVEMSLALMWTLFLPLGDRYSVDALRRPLARADRDRPVVSLAVFAITLQIAAIYTFNAWQKGGPAWDSGQAVHYVLWQNRAATSFAAWLRMHEPAWFSPFMTRATLWAELLCGVAVLCPVAQRKVRTAFLLVALWLHASIAISINVWPHSFIILVLDLLLLPPAVWERAAAAQPWRKRLHAFVAAKRRAAPLATAPASTTLVMLREGAVMVMLVAVLFRIAHDNAKLPEAIRPSGTSGLDPLIRYPRLYQRWSMFAEAPMDDGTIVVDAITSSGERIDPLTGAAPDLLAPLHGPWFLSQLECDYYLKIQRSDSAAYLPALVEYLKGWHVHEGRPESERLTEFRVYWVWNDSPPPGSTTPPTTGKRLLAQHP